jgi:GT2 family glycosyltransferase
MPTPSVHVLVINWNGMAHLDDCFMSLLASTYANTRFVLIDNASSDGSASHVRETFGQDSRVEVLELPKNLGWSGGNNAAIRHALDEGADHVLLLNNDTRVDPHCVERLVELAENDVSIGALAPKLLMFNDPTVVNSVGLIASTTGAAWDRGIGQPDGPEWDGHVPVIGVCGAGFFIRADALRKTGLLPEDFGIYLDDLDLSMRIWNAGYTILTCPEALIHHKFSATMGEREQARRKYHLNTRNRARILLRNFPLAKWPVAVFDYKIGEARAVGRAIANGEWWKARAHARSWFEAAAYIPAAIRERVARRRAGISHCRFWHLMFRRPQFFPGIPDSKIKVISTNETSA